MHLGRRRNLLLREEGGEITLDENSDGKSKRHSPPLEMCMQLSLVCISLVILFFGVAVTLIGFWAHQSQNEYISITDKPPELTRLPLSILVTGIFVALLGTIGLIGSVFFRTITGQTLLGTFAFVMVLVIISELGAGAAAVKLKFDFEDVYIESALRSQMMYGGDNETNEVSTAPEWDEFQKTHQCCGAEGYVNNISPYYKVFGNDSVPTSCCKQNIDEEDCYIYAKDSITYKQYINEKDCPDTVIGTIKENLLVMGIFVVVAGFSQLLAVFITVCLLYASSRLKRGREKAYHNYSKLSLKASSQLEAS